MIEDFRLRVFEMVCLRQSFSAAAKELGISQPAVSQNIAELEKDLGVSLFERLRTSVCLNEDGAKFREYARQILHWYDAANAAFSNPEEHKGVELELASGKQVKVWVCGDDIHLTLPSD